MYNKNIYDIFEERKFDVFYIEHFSFNDLDEIDMVFENIEKYILDDEYIVMEGFKDKIKDIKIDVKKKIKIFIQTIRKFFQDIFVKFNTKYEPLKKHIEKVGKEEIIKKLEGRKVRMPNFIEYKFDGFFNNMRRDFLLIDDFVKQGKLDAATNAFAGGNKFRYVKTGDDQLFEGNLTKKHIETLFDYVYNYKKFIDEINSNVENSAKILEKTLENKDDEQQDNINKTFKLIDTLSRNILSYVNKALMVTYKLIMHIPVKDKQLKMKYNHNDFIE